MNKTIHSLTGLYKEKSGEEQKISSQDLKVSLMRLVARLRTLSTKMENAFLTIGASRNYLPSLRI